MIFSLESESGFYRFEEIHLILDFYFVYVVEAFITLR